VSGTLADARVRTAARQAARFREPLSCLNQLWSTGSVPRNHNLQRRGLRRRHADFAPLHEGFALLHEDFALLHEVFDPLHVTCACDLRV
jgi:hypothetical protein